MCVCVFKVAKRQMRSSIRQPRKDQNRNCSTAAESTIVSHLFEGQLSYMTVCMHCDQQAHSTQSFTVLSLPIPADIIKCSIQVPSLQLGNTVQTVHRSYFRCWLSSCPYYSCFLTVLSLRCAGLPVTVLRADCADGRRADVVFGV